MRTASHHPQYRRVRPVTISPDLSPAVYSPLEQFSTASFLLPIDSSTWSATDSDLPSASGLRPVTELSDSSDERDNSGDEDTRAANFSDRRDLIYRHSAKPLPCGPILQSIQTPWSDNTSILKQRASLQPIISRKNHHSARVRVKVTEAEHFDFTRQRHWIPDTQISNPFHHSIAPQTRNYPLDIEQIDYSTTNQPHIRRPKDNSARYGFVERRRRLSSSGTNQLNYINNCRQIRRTGKNAQQKSLRITLSHNKPSHAGNNLLTVPNSNLSLCQKQSSSEFGTRKEMIIDNRNLNVPLNRYKHQDSHPNEDELPVDRPQAVFTPRSCVPTKMSKSPSQVGENIGGAHSKPSISNEELKRSFKEKLEAFKAMERQSLTPAFPSKRDNYSSRQPSKPHSHRSPFTQRSPISQRGPGPLNSLESIRPITRHSNSVTPVKVSSQPPCYNLDELSSSASSESLQSSVLLSDRKNSQLVVGKRQELHCGNPAGLWISTEFTYDKIPSDEYREAISSHPFKSNDKTEILTDDVCPACEALATADDIRKEKARFQGGMKAVNERLLSIIRCMNTSHSLVTLFENKHAFANEISMEAKLLRDQAAAFENSPPLSTRTPTTMGQVTTNGSGTHSAVGSKSNMMLSSLVRLFANPFKDGRSSEGWDCNSTTRSDGKFPIDSPGVDSPNLFKPEVIHRVLMSKNETTASSPEFPHNLIPGKFVGSLLYSNDQLSESTCEPSEPSTLHYDLESQRKKLIASAFMTSYTPSTIQMNVAMMRNTNARRFRSGIESLAQSPVPVTREICRKGDEEKLNGFAGTDRSVDSLYTGESTIAYDVKGKGNQVQKGPWDSLLEGDSWHSNNQKGSSVANGLLLGQQPGDGVGVTLQSKQLIALLDLLVDQHDLLMQMKGFSSVIVSELNDLSMYAASFTSENEEKYNNDNGRTSSIEKDRQGNPSHSWRFRSALPHSDSSDFSIMSASHSKIDFCSQKAIESKCSYNEFLQDPKEFHNARPVNGLHTASETPISHTYSSDNIGEYTSSPSPPQTPKQNSAM